MTLPVVYAADPQDLKTAVRDIRHRVKGLKESRLYWMAVALTVLSRTGSATHWQSWDSPPPGRAQQFGRKDLEDALWQLLGTTPEALLRPDAPLLGELNHPRRVLLDLLYDPREALTLVADVPVSKRADSVKVNLEAPDWVWSTDSHIRTRATNVVEYNPVNTMNQQNGIACAWPTDEAAKRPHGPQEVYSVSRTQCVNRIAVVGRDPVCRLNNEACGGSGDGAGRTITKPRLLAPAVSGEKRYVVLPGTIEALVAQATRNGAPLPRARDLSLLTSWCAAGGRGNLDANRLIELLGAPGLRVLTSRS